VRHGVSGAAPGIFICEGCSPGDLGDHESPLVGSKGEAPVRRSEDEVPNKLKQFADIVCRLFLYYLLPTR